MREALIIPVILGIAYAAAPGVVNTECLRRGISTGFRSAFGVQLGALLGDGVWAVIAFSGLAALSRATSLLDAIGLAGGLFLCKIAIDAFRDAVHGRSAADGTVESSAMRTGVIFGVANPAALAFWSGVGGGVLATKGNHDSAGSDLVPDRLSDRGDHLVGDVQLAGERRAALCPAEGLPRDRCRL